MEIGRKHRLTSLHPSCVLLVFFGLICQYCHSQKEFQVGVILDMGSWNGKMVHSCITIAASDFYNLHAHYKTRIVPQTIDSKGDPLLALEAGNSDLFVAQRHEHIFIAFRQYKFNIKFLTV